MRLRSLSTLAILTTLGALAACGGDDEATTDAAAPTASAGAGGASASGGSSSGGTSASGGSSQGGTTGAGGATGGAAGAQGGSGQGGDGQGGSGGAPQGEGVFVPELGAPVDAVYDEHGFLHLTAQSDDDVAAALGYLHASNRFFFMDFVRRVVRGQLGAIVRAGEAVTDLDAKNRLFYSTAQGEPLEKVLLDQGDEPTRAMLSAYARGVNAWLEDMRAGRNGAALTKEYDFLLIDKSYVRPWEPEDSAAIGLYVMRDLSESSGAEIFRGKALGALSPELGADLVTPRPLFDVSTKGEADGPSMPMPTPPSPPTPFAAVDPAAHARFAPLVGLLDRAERSLGGMPFEPPREVRRPHGSNNWAIAPSRTASKHGLIANDPHLGLANPSIWFPVELDSKSKGTGTLHVAGGSFPGLPIVLTGHNESLGWGVTVIYYDLTDVYVEKLSDDGKSVEFNGQMVPIIEKQVAIDDISTGTPVMKTMRWVPHHGPIISEDLAKKEAITVRWVAHEGTTDLQGFLGIGRANSTTEAREALKQITSANQNFVVVDKNGDVGWFPYGKVPKRPWASKDLDPSAPLPGDGSAEWQGFLSTDELPQLFNPKNGFVATANQEMTGASSDGDPYNDGQAAIQSWDKDEGTRLARITQMMEAGGNEHSIETMRAMQGDTRMLYGELLAPELVKAADVDGLDPKAGEVAAAIKAWQYTCPSGIASTDKNAPKKGPKSEDPTEASESIGCAAFHVTMFALARAALGDELGAAGLSAGPGLTVMLVSRAINAPETLASGEAFWDDVSTADVTETRDEIMRKALLDAAGILAKLGGPDEWRWGRMHSLTLRSIFDGFGTSSYNDGPWSTPGGFNTVNVATPSGDTTGLELGHSSGASLRTLIEVTPEGPRMKFQYPGGASLDRKSQFYNNMVSRWIKVEPVDFAFGPGAVTSPAVQLTVQPAK